MKLKLPVKSYSFAIFLAKGNFFYQFVSTLAASLKIKFQSSSFSALVNIAGNALYASFAETFMEQFDGMVIIHLKELFIYSKNLYQCCKMAQVS